MTPNIMFHLQPDFIIVEFSNKMGSWTPCNLQYKTEFESFKNSYYTSKIVRIRTTKLLYETNSNPHCNNWILKLAIPNPYLINCVLEKLSSQLYTINTFAKTKIFDPIMLPVSINFLTQGTEIYTLSIDSIVSALMEDMNEIIILYFMNTRNGYICYPDLFYNVSVLILSYLEIWARL